MYIMTWCYLLFTFISRLSGLSLRMGNIFYFISLRFFVVFFPMTGIIEGWGQPEACKRCCIAPRGREGCQTSLPGSAVGQTQCRKRHRAGSAGWTGSYCSGPNHIASVCALCGIQPSHPCSLPTPASGGQETKFPRDSPRSFPKRWSTLFPLQTPEN